MLDAAGVEYQAIPSRVDEAAIKARPEASGEIAEKLAQAKALDVSAARPDVWVIGSDSVVRVEGRQFDKPESREQAASTLR